MAVGLLTGTVAPLLPHQRPQLGVVADPAVYTRGECAATLARIHEGSGGLQLVCKVGELDFSLAETSNGL
jgi:hypothetical protein